jgi:hypothetical protein
MQRERKNTCSRSGFFIISVLVEGAAENLKGSFLFGVLLLPKLKLSLDVEVTMV